MKQQYYCPDCPMNWPHPDITRINFCNYCKRAQNIYNNNFARYKITEKDCRKVLKEQIKK